MRDLSLKCWVYDGDSSRTFFVDISTTRPVADLKEAIKKKKSVKFRDVDADDLDLYLFFPSGGGTLNQQLTKWSLVGQTYLEMEAKLSALGLTEDSVIIVHIPGSEVNLNCWVYGEDVGQIFPVKIPGTKDVDQLKKAIKSQKSVSFQSVDPDALDLYLFSPSGGDSLDQQLTKWSLVGQTRLEMGAKLSGLGLKKDSIIIVNVPSAELKLNCWVYGEDVGKIFPIKIMGTETVADLKKVLKKDLSLEVHLRDVDLYVFSPSGSNSLKDQLEHWTLNNKEPLDPLIKLSNLHRNAESLFIVNVPGSVPSLAHPPSSITPGKTIKAARHKFIEDNPTVSPSSGGQFLTFRKRQNDSKTIIHCNRPGTAVAPIPATLLHPAIGQLLDDCDTHAITAADNSFTLDLYSVMSDIYDLEWMRAKEVRKVFADHGLDFTVSGIGVESRHNTDGNISLNKRPYVIVEFKNEVGSKGAEPSIQGSLYYLEATREYAEAIADSPLPCILILFFGPYMSIVGAAWNLRPAIQPLSCALPVYYHPTDTGMQIKVARHLGALKKAVRTLEEYYRSLESEVHVTVASSQAQLFPHPTSFSPLEGGRDREDFKYTDQPFQDKLLFFGTVSDLHPVCIKFVRRYSKDAHLACASLGYAPTLRGFEKIPGGWFMVVMDRLPSEYVLLRSCTPTPPLVEHIRDVLTKLHQRGYVHGDVRDTNIMVCKSEETKFMLVDFDWAGKIGEVRYPMNVHRGKDLWRPEGAIDEELIKADHDMDMLNNIAARTIVD